MRKLFVEGFLSPPLPEDLASPEMLYDEDRALNVLPDGSPVIELGLASRGTVTMTKVRSETDDADSPENEATATTKVNVDRDDLARVKRLGTSTGTRIRNEPDDEDRDARAAYGVYAVATWTTTKSGVGTEPDDQDRDSAAAGEESLRLETRTVARAEVDEQIAIQTGALRLEAATRLDLMTKTFVAGEAEGFWFEDHADGPRVGLARLVP